MRRFLDKNRLAVAAPIVMLAAALAAVAWLDATTGGEAKPEPYLGTIGTPVRGTYVPPTATPPGAQRTPRPRPTSGPLTGSGKQRDGVRETDAVLVIGALQQWKAQNGSFISTNNQIQTLCAYKEVDKGCALKDILGREVPMDPLGNSEGYWYQSDGTNARLFVNYEREIPPEQRCDTDYVDFEDKPSIICADLR